jgi:hypothetical protein
MMICLVQCADVVVWEHMRRDLWPDQPETHAIDIGQSFARPLDEPQAVLVVQEDATIIAWVETLDSDCGQRPFSKIRRPGIPESSSGSRPALTSTRGDERKVGAPRLAGLAGRGDLEFSFRKSNWMRLWQKPLRERFRHSETAVGRMALLQTASYRAPT